MITEAAAKHPLVLALRELQTKGFIMLDKAQGTREQAVFSDCIEKAFLPWNPSSP